MIGSGVTVGPVSGCGTNGKTGGLEALGDGVEVGVKSASGSGTSETVGVGAAAGSRSGVGVGNSGVGINRVQVLAPFEPSMH